MRACELQHHGIVAIRLSLERNPFSLDDPCRGKACCQRGLFAQYAAHVRPGHTIGVDIALERAFDQARNLFLVERRCLVTRRARRRNVQVTRVRFVEQNTGGRVLAGIRLRPAVDAEARVARIGEIVKMLHKEIVRRAPDSTRHPSVLGHG